MSDDPDCDNGDCRFCKLRTLTVDGETKDYCCNPTCGNSDADDDGVGKAFGTGKYCCPINDPPFNEMVVFPGRP